MDIGVILKRFETPDEVREMPLGRFEVVRIGGLTIGRATYRPGWRWSQHVGPGVGAERCSVEHVGMVVSGVATAAFADGRVVALRPGDLFYIPPEPHDSWVVGGEPYVSLARSAMPSRCAGPGAGVEVGGAVAVSPAQGRPNEALQPSRGGRRR
jgi:hypothetical protein